MTTSIIKDYPYPLAVAWNAVETETRHPFIRLHRCLDALETLVRYCAGITLCSLNTQQLDAGLREQLVENMEHPTLGRWVALLRDALPFADLKRTPELKNFYKKSLNPRVDGEVDLVNLRNRVAHGGVIDDARAKDLLAQADPPFANCLKMRPFCPTPRWWPSVKGSKPS